jgi:hypothetical protein
MFDLRRQVKVDFLFFLGCHACLIPLRLYEVIHACRSSRFGQLAFYRFVPFLFW